MQSKYFSTNSANKSSKLTSKNEGLKIWGQSKPTNSGLSNGKTFKSFTTDKDRIQKIFAPKLTVLDEQIITQEKIVNLVDQEFKNIIKIDSPESIFKKLTNKEKFKNENTSKENYNKIQKIIKNNHNHNLFDYIKTSWNKILSRWWDSIKFDYYEKNWFRKLNYQFVALDIAKNFTKAIVCFFVISFFGFFAYLSFFDQYFTIKKYLVEYSQGSYLNQDQTYKLINHFQKNKLYNIFPNNQYWFANNISLSASAKEIFPDINSVEIDQRTWPNQVKLIININKPTLTLAVIENNESKYWRINENGKVTTQDKAALWYNIVKVEKPYTLQDTQNQRKLSLMEHSFESNPSQKQRFELTKALLDYFKNNNIQINSTTFPSISDTDIFMESGTGTKFLFDSLIFDNDIQIERLDYFLNSKVDKDSFKELEMQSRYSYIDMRIPHKVHTCGVSDKCNEKPEN